MKKLLLKTMLLLCALIVGSGTMWADSYTITFATGSGDGTSASTSTACSAVVSAGDTYLSGNLVTATKVYYGGSDGLKLGTSSAAGVIKMNLASNVTPTSIVVNAKLYNSSKAATLKVNGSAAQNITSSFSNLTFDITSEISYIQLDVSKYCWIKSITVNYAAASSAEATTTTIDASGITNTNVYAGTEAGSLSATVKDNSDDEIDGATVTWSGDNDEVATIDAKTGAVTLVAAGTVTFTANYAGVEDEYASSSDTYEMTVTNVDPDIVTIWSENFSTYDEGDVPAGGTYAYACANGASDTKIYEASYAGGTSPELLVGKTGGSFTATIPLLYPTYGYSGNLTLTFKANNTNVAVTTSTEGVTVTGSIVAGTNTLTLSGITTSMANVVITFTNSTSSNVRIDDIVLKGKQAELTFVATPSISPAGGAVASGTEITMTCGTDGATIYYTTDGSTPTPSSTAYNPASKPTITSACTIKAIGIKDGLTDSEVASATYTIAEPCATPTFSVAEGVVEKGTTVTIGCETADATIYYTLNGDTPTTSSYEYSSAITINKAQTIKAIAVKDGYANSEVASATYTVRDYATLPFSYDNGKSSLTTGLTESGLGSDYASAPKLKFDHTGDEMILKINERPGLLAFDIKGNSFSGGTFKVQTSADGVEYTDLDTYTELGSSTATMTYDDFAENIRYIKWIYTSKSSGNVALGNIKAYATPYTRNVTNIGNFGTICLPCDAIITGAYLYSIAGEANGWIYLNEETTLEAGNPYIFEATAEAVKCYYTSTEEATEAETVNGLVGSLTGTSVPTGKYILKNNEIRLAGTGVTIGANRAYIDLSEVPAYEGGADVKAISIFDTTTGINGIDATTKGEAIYNIAGQKVQKAQKGLYIVNGKKVVF